MFARNVARDRLHDAPLAEAGWTVVRIREHEAASDAPDRVVDALAGAHA